MSTRQKRAIPLLLTAILLTSCSSPSPRTNFRDAQRLVDDLAARHDDLVRLTIHAVPTGRKSSRIIACNLPEKIGQPSDPEDIEAMHTGRTIVLREGDNLDVTAPLTDRLGKPVAAAGITLKCPPTADQDTLTAQAKTIADQLSQAIQNARSPLW